MNLTFKRCAYIEALIIIGLLLFLWHKAVPPTPSLGEQRTLVTALHLGELVGYTQVYSDPSTDFAVYVQDSYVANKLKSGDVVSLEGTTGTVVSVSDKEFSVVVENASKIVPGVSGNMVSLNTWPVGFISGWDGQGALRCIFY